jgi:hypothetical protein
MTDLVEDHARVKVRGSYFTNAGSITASWLPWPPLGRAMMMGAVSSPSPQQRATAAFRF